MNTVMLLVTFFIATVMSLPHVGMLDTPTVRDVGLIFDDHFYKGNSTFLIETVDTPTCIPINVDANGHPQGLHIASVQVCKPTTCVFSEGENCTGNPTGTFSVSCKGPGDVPKHDPNTLYKSYICGTNLSKSFPVEDSEELVTVPHDPNAGMV